MGRIPQPKAARGSQYWLQELVHREPALVDEAIGLGRLDWVSPLADDQYAEYRDGAFLDRLRISLPVRPLAGFWPNRGPVWDGLATTSSGGVVLVEAKSHTKELLSSCAASPDSRRLIATAFDDTKAALRARSDADWCSGYYQYANRLAHAYLLAQVNRLDATLVFLHFVGDADMGGPETINEWREAIESVHEHLGLTKGLPSYVTEAFVTVSGR